MRTITNCRSCDSADLKLIVDFGKQYLSDFRPDDTKPPLYPLELVICLDCMLVQLRHTVPSHEMYHERYGFKSGVSESIKNDLKEVVEQALEARRHPKTWLDIASNDGTLLSYVPKSIYRAGIDPVGFLCKEAKQHATTIVNDFFNPEAFDTLFDIITSVSMFYDLDDPNKFVSGVEQVLAAKGVWVIQQNYLLTTLQLNAIDNVCHEHLEYYTLQSLESLLERHGLEVFKLGTSMINGGSIRTFVARKGDYPIDESVGRQRAIEAEYGIDRLAAYEVFGAGVAESIGALKSLVNQLADGGASIYIMAASTRGATIWQACGFGPDVITAAVERNPAKVGMMFSAIGVPIISEEQARAEKPDFALIGPWFLKSQFINRMRDMIADGTKVIMPLPELLIIDQENVDNE